MEDCLLCESKEGPTLIRTYDYWSLLVNFKQPTLGACLLVANKHTESIFDLHNRETAEYWKAIRQYENAVKKAFQPDRVNQLMLANIEPHIHYHLVPRYSNERQFAGRVWTDNPGMPILGSDLKDQETLDLVIGSIREHLP